MEKINILIIEDEAIIAMDLMGCLQREGYNIAAVVNNGQDALLAFQKETVDMILCDINILGAWYDLLEEFAQYKIQDNLLVTSREVSDMAIKYETAQKEAEIANLNTVNSLKTKQLWGLGIGLVLAALAAGLIFYLYRQSKTATQVIQTQSNKLSTLMRELHHRVKNNLQILSPHRPERCTSRERQQNARRCHVFNSPKPLSNRRCEHLRHQSLHHQSVRKPHASLMQASCKPTAIRPIIST